MFQKLETGGTPVLLWFALGLLSSVFCPLALAQNYSIDWFTIDGGGGTSIGGTYSVTGTIGQPDPGAMSAGNLTVQGGFWPGLVVPSTTGAPTLFIRFVDGNVVFFWSPVMLGFVLEESTSLDSPSWSPGPSGNPTAPIPTTGQVKFYRLRRPSNFNLKP